jgi:hypothetical protein
LEFPCPCGAVFTYAWMVTSTGAERAPGGMVMVSTPSDSGFAL